MTTQRKSNSEHFVPGAYVTVPCKSVCVPYFADNAAALAGGVSVGALYTSNGRDVLMVVASRRAAQSAH